MSPVVVETTKLTMSVLTGGTTLCGSMQHRRQHQPSCSPTAPKPRAPPPCDSWGNIIATGTRPRPTHGHAPAAAKTSRPYLADSSTIRRTDPQYPGYCSRSAPRTRPSPLTPPSLAHRPRKSRSPLTLTPTATWTGRLVTCPSRTSKWIRRQTPSGIPANGPILPPSLTALLS